MVPAKTLVTLKRTFGPETVTRNNLFNAVTINGTPKPGYSTGDAIKAVEEVAKQSLPRGYGYEWTGITREEIKTSGQTAFIFFLSILFVYFFCWRNMKVTFFHLPLFLPFLQGFSEYLPSQDWLELITIFMFR
jgi:multidrug efflux pump subunit AcrB